MSKIGRKDYGSNESNDLNETNEMNNRKINSIFE